MTTTTVTAPISNKALSELRTAADRMAKMNSPCVDEVFWTNFLSAIVELQAVRAAERNQRDASQ